MDGYRIQPAQEYVTCSITPMVVIEGQQREGQGEEMMFMQSLGLRSKGEKKSWRGYLGCDQGGRQAAEKMLVFLVLP